MKNILKYGLLSLARDYNVIYIIVIFYKKTSVMVKLLNLIK